MFSQDLKNKSPSHDGWTMEFYLELFYLLVDEILRVVDESTVSNHISGALNVTLITLIPKNLNPSSFDDFRPISLCNFLYKVIAKIIANMVKGVMSSCIYE
jgi:hypothetical protein